MLPAVPLRHDVVHDDEEVRIATWAGVVTTRWRRTPTREKLELLGQHQQRLADATMNHQIVAVTVLSPKAGLMLTGEARKEAENLARAGREYLLGQAQVVEGEGFMAAAARAVMSGIQLAVRAGYPVKIFGKLDDALPWIAELLREAGHERDADDVASALPDAVGPTPR
jgi:hypothetical protein